MSNRIKVKPLNPEAVMYDPTTGRLLPPEGEWFADHQFWRRRHLAGEVALLEEGAIDPDAPSSSSTPTGLEPLTPLTTR